MDNRFNLHDTFMAFWKQYIRFLFWLQNDTHSYDLIEKCGKYYIVGGNMVFLVNWVPGLIIDCFTFDIKEICCKALHIVPGAKGLSC